MTARLVSIVRRPPIERAQRAITSAFWRLFSADHTHDYQRVQSLPMHVCLTCGATLRRIGG